MRPVTCQPLFSKTKEKQRNKIITLNPTVMHAVMRPVTCQPLLMSKVWQLRSNHHAVGDSCKNLIFEFRLLLGLATRWQSLRANPNMVHPYAFSTGRLV
jgi:hypothetical protein